jgi:N-acyl-D-aspartate/D-glutamate deacylase
MHDLIIRGATLVDGTGADARTADIAVDGDRISEVGRVDGEARRTFEADGLLATPGFVDIHTHYDAQVTWDPQLSPSNAHGVTTAIFGNCGVGFAPCAPDRHRFLIELMEGVEDIPGSAIEAGIRWEWESFPEYLDALGRCELALDVGAHIAHGAVRAYVMGDRGGRNEPATPDDIAKMAAIVKQAVAAGALGFSTSRTRVHRALDGEPVPGTFAAEDELFAIGRAMGELGRGVFEVAQAGSAGEMLERDGEGVVLRELDWMARLSRETGRPVSFVVLQSRTEPELWREQLEVASKEAAAGAVLVAQISGRPPGILVGLQGEYHPFRYRPSYQEIDALPIAERVARMKDPERKARILAEASTQRGTMDALFQDPERLFPVGDPPCYEPRREHSLGARAVAENRDLMDLVYDVLLENEGRQLILLPGANFANFDIEVVREMLDHPLSVLSLSDGGAHCGFIADASTPSFMLSHWVRDRDRGPRMRLETVVQRMTSDTAQVYGLSDRGTVKPGMKADLNLIDFDNLELLAPEMLFDLPGGGRRLCQGARGYRATILSGVVTQENDEPTGALPGRLVRGG